MFIAVHSDIQYVTYIHACIHACMHAYRSFGRTLAQSFIGELYSVFRVGLGLF
jgi:hypothetical protein